MAETWGRLSALRPLPVIDGLLVATALVHNLALATRNVRDFAGTGVTGNRGKTPGAAGGLFDNGLNPGWFRDSVGSWSSRRWTLILCRLCC